MAMQMNEFFSYGGNEPQWREVGDRQRPYDYRANITRSSGRQLPTIEFKVPMCCAKCEEKVREELSELEGVYEVFVDQLSGRVVVTGYVDPFAALKKMKRIKKKSEFLGGSSNIKTSYGRERSEKSHKKHNLRPGMVHHSTSSQISYNQKPSRTSGSRGVFSRNVYDDEQSPISSSRGLSYRNTYDNEPFRSASSGGGLLFRNTFDDEPFRASSARGLSYRNGYDSYDDEPSRISSARGPSRMNTYRDEPFRASGARRLSYRNGYDSCDDEPFRQSSSYRVLPYGNRYNSDDDEAFYSRSPSSSSFSYLPQSQSLRYESVPPYAQNYYTEEYPKYVCY